MVIVSACRSCELVAVVVVVFAVVVIVIGSSVHHQGKLTMNDHDDAAAIENAHCNSKVPVTMVAVDFDKTTVVMAVVENDRRSEIVDNCSWLLFVDHQTVVVVVDATTKNRINDIAMRKKSRLMSKRYTLNRETCVS